MFFINFFHTSQSTKKPHVCSFEADLKDLNFNQYIKKPINFRLILLFRSLVLLIVLCAYFYFLFSILHIKAVCQFLKICTVWRLKVWLSSDTFCVVTQPKCFLRKILCWSGLSWIFLQCIVYPLYQLKLPAIWNFSSESGIFFLIIPLFLYLHYEYFHIYFWKNFWFILLMLLYYIASYSGYYVGSCCVYNGLWPEILERPVII